MFSKFYKENSIRKESNNKRNLSGCRYRNIPLVIEVKKKRNGFGAGRVSYDKLVFILMFRVISE